jgi:spore coat polysaccharide biosynthesis protein SpsF
MLPYRSEDPEIFQYCRSRDWKVWEGSMDNVLDRYASFVRNDEGDDREQYARITADCPLLPRTLLTSMIDYAESKPMDYLTNRPWAIDGWDVEIFSKRLILGLDRVLPADSPDREHVLSYMNHMDQTQPGFVWPCHPIWCEQFDGESVKFSVDTKEDLEYIERIV